MKRIFITILILISLISLYAQSPLKFNVHIDPQFSWFSSDEKNVEPDGSRFHVTTGLQMDYFFEKNYAFALGFGINNLGGSLRYADSALFISKGDSLWATPGQTINHHYQYLDFPIGLKLKTEELGYLTFFLQVGFNPMININANISTKDDSFDREDIRESTHLFMLGYHAGVGAEYRLGGSTALIGGVRWTSGLTDVTDLDKANIHQNSISIHLGILF